MPIPAVFLLILLLIGTCATAWRKIDSSPVFMHLKAGERILESRTAPTTDAYAAASNPQGWVYMEWVWGGLLALAHGQADWVGVSALNLTGVALLAAFLLLRGRRRGARWGENLVVVTFTLAAMVSGFQPLPERLALVLFVLALLLSEARKLWPLVFLPLIAWAWANSHPAFVLAFVVPVCRVILPPRQPDGSRGKSPAAYLIVITMTCIAAALVNPYSIRIVSSAYQTFRFSTADTLQHAAEIYGTLPMMLQMLAAAGLAALALSARHLLQRWEMLLGALLLLGCVVSPLSLTFFLMYAAAPAAAGLTLHAANLWNTLRLNWAASAAAVLAVAAMLAGNLTASRLDPRAFGAGVRPDLFPEAAAGRLASLPLRNTLLNMPEDGGYLAWRVWPSWKITMDERSSLYTPAQREQYDLLWQGGTGWQEQLNYWRVYAVLGRPEVAEMYPNTNLFYHLADSPDWSPVYWDRHSILYLESTIGLGNSHLHHYRQLKPGLSWAAQAARINSAEQWRDLTADLRRALVDDPGNIVAQEFLKKAQEALGAAE